MGQDEPHGSEEPVPGGGESSLAEALDLRRQVRRGTLGGLVTAAAVFAFFVAVPGTYRSPVLYLGLAVVVAVTVGGLLTLVLVAASTRRLARRL